MPDTAHKTRGDFTHDESKATAWYLHTLNMIAAIPAHHVKRKAIVRAATDSVPAAKSMGSTEVPSTMPLEA